ncbi:MAG: hypothetical protein KJ722_02200, partial [Candidatus Omnitrophica bacterium]|nr:hypothetical protein [Candidatus Omnitrophota bacterium]
RIKLYFKLRNRIVHWNDNTRFQLGHYFTGFFGRYGKIRRSAVMGRFSVSIGKQRGKGII